MKRILFPLLPADKHKAGQWMIDLNRKRGTFVNSGALYYYVKFELVSTFLPEVKPTGLAETNFLSFFLSFQKDAKKASKQPNQSK